MNTRARILEADKRFVFRPYTGTEEHANEDSLVVVAAEGPFLIDADGRRFLDASGAWWTNHLGYQHPRLIAALTRQASTLAHAPLAGATHGPAAELAEKAHEASQAASGAADRAALTTSEAAYEAADALQEAADEVEAEEAAAEQPAVETAAKPAARKRAPAKKKAAMPVNDQSVA